MSPSCGISGSLDVLNKWQSTSLSISRNTQKFDASVDGNLANDKDSMSVFSKVIGSELFDSLSANIYLRCQMDFTSNAVRTEAPNFVDLGLLAVNASDEFNTFGTPATRVIRPTDVPHWYLPDHVIGEATAVGMSGTRSEPEYSYKTDYKNWRKIRTLGAKIFE